jgi:hypothetical protein
MTPPFARLGTRRSDNPSSCRSSNSRGRPTPGPSLAYRPRSCRQPDVAPYALGRQPTLPPKRPGIARNDSRDSRIRSLSRDEDQQNPIRRSAEIASSSAQKGSSPSSYAGGEGSGVDEPNSAATSGISVAAISLPRSPNAINSTDLSSCTFGVAPTHWPIRDSS